MSDNGIRERVVKWFVAASIVFSFTYYIFNGSLHHIGRDGSKAGNKSATQSHERDAELPSASSRKAHPNPHGGQFVSRPPPPPPRTRFPLERYGAAVGVLYAFMAFAYSLLLISNFILCLLDLDSLESYRYLDCLLVGRITMAGKYSRIARYTVFVFTLFEFSWVFIMVLAKPMFDLACLDFMLHDHQEVVRCESTYCAHLEANSQQQMTRDTFKGANPELVDTMLFKTFDPKATLIKMSTFSELDSLKLAKARSRRSAKVDRQKSLSSLQACRCNQAGHAARQTYILRPNRTAESRQWLVSITWYYIVIMVTSISLATPVAIWLLAPTFVSQQGFRLNHANCIHYFDQRPELWGAEHNQFQFMHLDWPLNATSRPLNGYEIARITSDVISSVIFWLLTLCAFVFDTYITIIIAADTLAYTERVRARITRVARELDRLQVVKIIKSLLGCCDQRVDCLSRSKLVVVAAKPPPPHSSSRSTQKNPEIILSAHMEPRSRDQRQLITLSALDDGSNSASFRDAVSPGELLAADGLDTELVVELVSSDILATQTMIVDFFHMIKRHNAYVSFYLLYCILFWLVLSMVNALFYMNLNNRGVLSRLEIYLIELAATSYFVLVCSLFAMARRIIHQAYPHLATIMALDNSSEGTKERWCAILRYFYPIPLDCFSMFRFNEISWLFGMKLVAWVLSAFLVVLNFQRVYLDQEVGQMNGEAAGLANTTTENNNNNSSLLPLDVRE